MKLTITLGLLGLILFSCNKKKDSNDTIEISKLKISYANQLLDNYSSLKQNISILADRHAIFNTTLQLSHYNVLKAQWKETKKAVDYIAPFQFLNESTFYSFMINPAYIDAFGSDNSSGIIVNTTLYPYIDYVTLRSLNNVGGSENNISTGMHALEFVLWGEDLNPAGPGARTPFDYEFTAASVKGRRKAYLASLVYILNKDVEALDYTSFKDNINDMDPKSSLKFLLGGIHDFVKKNVAEKSIKRPVDQMSQLYEESQFSDNSTEDLKNKITSIKNYLYGSQYTTTDGYFISDYMKTKSPNLRDKMDQLIEELVSDSQEMTFTFDNAIQNPAQRQQLIALYDKLIALSGVISSFAKECNVML